MADDFSIVDIIDEDGDLLTLMEADEDPDYLVVLIEMGGAGGPIQASVALDEHAVAELLKAVQAFQRSRG